MARLGSQNRVIESTRLLSPESRVDPHSFKASLLEPEGFTVQENRFYLITTPKSPVDTDSRLSL